MFTLRRLLTALLVPTLCACANGSPGLSGYEQEEDGEGGAGGTAPSTSSGSSSSSNSSSSSGGNGDGGAGGEGDQGGAGGGGGAEPECTYDAPASCAAAEELNGISGDSGSDRATASGSTSRWFKINIAEDSLGSTQISYTASLTSPAGMNFDLYAYRGNGDAPNCLASGTKGQGSPESLTDHWSDTFGSDDGIWFIFEVRYESGTACGADATWRLSVAGHTVP